MKKLLPPVGAGVAVAALLYGILCAAERRLPESLDPWLDAFIADGMKAEFRSDSTEPLKHLQAVDARSMFDGPSVAGTQLRNYLVQNSSVQIVRLPAEGLVKDIPEGRKQDSRFKTGGQAIHVFRSGRTIAFLSPFGKWIPIVGQMKTAKKDVEQIFDSIEEVARRLP